MPKSKLLRIVTILAALSAATAFAANGLEGAVSGPDGKPMEGVAVSARASDKTYTTTVFTDKAGKYSFPQVESGQYKIWAQAVGFEYAGSEASLVSGKKARQDFSLKALKEYSRQLSGAEWAESLPEQQPGDHRMKAVLVNTCSGCHPLGFPLQNRFDQAGWNKIVDVMEKIGGTGYINVKQEIPYANVHAYREEIISYLVRVRGPNAPELDYKVFRPKGDATQVVVTEYDLPRADLPAGTALKHNGSNWSEGTPSGSETWFGIHDTWVDSKANVWFSDDTSPERTIGKLDTHTGKVTSYKLVAANGKATRSHGIVVDRNDTVWFTNGSTRSLTKFDPSTEQFQNFPIQEGAPRSGGSLIADSKGNLWVEQSEGALKLDPKTGKYTVYNAPVKGGGSYGIAVDAKDNAWYVRFSGDRLGVIDPVTGEATEIALDDSGLTDITDKDKEVRRIAPGNGFGASIYQKGPRRLGGDAKGDSVWVALNYAGRLAKVDINTRKVTEYALPSRYTSPYQVTVDKNHMVWMNLNNADRVAKFDPSTEKWTEYMLPTRGTGSRHIVVDNSTPSPTIYVPYNRNGKIARIQFRNSTTTVAQR